MADTAPGTAPGTQHPARHQAPSTRHVAPYNRARAPLLRALAPMLGANHVSLHDAHVSIAAGFRDDELPRALGLDADTWDVRCTVNTLGAYRMIAVKRA